MEEARLLHISIHTKFRRQMGHRLGPGIRDRKDDKGGGANFRRDSVFIILIVVIVSRVYMYVKAYEIVQFN